MVSWTAFRIHSLYTRPHPLCQHTYGSPISFYDAISDTLHAYQTKDYGSTLANVIERVGLPDIEILR